LEDSTEAWQAIKLEAAQSDQNIVLYLNTLDSSNCAAFEQNTLNDPTVRLFLEQQVVWASLDRTATLMGEALSQRYDVSLSPTILVLDPSGRELGRISGRTLSPQELIGSINRIEAEAVTPDRPLQSKKTIRIGLVDPSRLQRESDLFKFLQEDLQQLQTLVSQQEQQKLQKMKQTYQRYLNAKDAGQSWNGPVPPDPQRFALDQQVQRAFKLALENLYQQYDQYIAQAAYPIIEEEQLALLVGPKILLDGDPLSVETVDITDALIPLLNQYLQSDELGRKAQRPRVNVPSEYIKSFSGIQLGQTWLEMFKDRALILAQSGENMETLLEQINLLYKRSLEQAVPHMRKLYRSNIVFDTDGSVYFMADDIEAVDDAMIKLMLEAQLSLPTE